jgi:hypothetical protein
MMMMMMMITSLRGPETLALGPDLEGNTVVGDHRMHPFAQPGGGDGGVPNLAGACVRARACVCVHECKITIKTNM